MKRLAIAAVTCIIAASPSAQAGTCLTADIMNPSGEQIMSPYGVDRSGHAGASHGYHQGLDIVNSQGAGTKIFSGSSGPVKFYPFGGGGVIADVLSGDTRFIYLHMATTALNSGQSGTVAAGDQVGTMGCEGMKVCRPHLHLGALLNGKVLAANGYNGRTWKFRTGKGVPLTADQIKGALPDAWYYVNPEPFLPRQIKIANPYPDMEGGRRTQSLPRTCNPSTESVNSDMPSAAATQSQESAVTGAASIPSGSTDHAVKIANQENRSLLIELGKINATELTANVNAMEYQARMDAVLAQLVALYAIDGAPSRSSRP